MHGTPWRVRPTSGPRLPLRRHRNITGLIGAGIPALLAVEGEDAADSAVRTEDDVLASTPTALRDVLRMDVAVVARTTGRAGGVAERDPGVAAPARG